VKLEEVLPALREGKSISRYGKTSTPINLRNADGLLADDWEIIEEPKPKKKLYLWVVQDQPGDDWITLTTYYPDEDTARQRSLRRPGAVFKRLGHTVIEVDE